VGNDYQQRAGTGNQPEVPRASGVEPGGGAPERAMLLTVVYTTPEATRYALNMGIALAQGLPTTLRLLVPQVVPYPLGLERGPVDAEFNERRMRELVSASPLDVAVEILLCRDPLAALAAALPRSSTVMVGVRRGWWRWSERRLARQLARMGHQVVIAKKS
jgi:hypothetical protein